MEELGQKDELDLNKGHINFVLNSYNDIFSSFDPRHYSERAISDDFLAECQKAAHDKKEPVELMFLISGKKRNISEEKHIKKRLKEHFFKHFKEKEKEIKKIKREGITWFLLGTIITAFGAILLQYQGFLIDLLIIMSEPAGWFMFWEGLDKVFITSKEIKPDYQFYKIMNSAEISFANH